MLFVGGANPVNYTKTMSNFATAALRDVQRCLIPGAGPHRLTTIKFPQVRKMILVFYLGNNNIGFPVHDDEMQHTERCIPSLNIHCVLLWSNLDTITSADFKFQSLCCLNIAQPSLGCNSLQGYLRIALLDANIDVTACPHERCPSSEHKLMICSYQRLPSSLPNVRLPAHTTLIAAMTAGYPPCPF